MSVNTISGISSAGVSGSIKNDCIRYGMDAAKNARDAFLLESMEHSARTADVLKYPNLKYGDDEYFIEAIDSFSKKLERDEFTPRQYRYKYSVGEGGEYDKLSLLGASYQELGQTKEVPNQTLTNQLKNSFGLGKNNVFDAGVLDTNQNGNVEIDEYAAFLALCDIKSTDKNSQDVKDMNGVITGEGIDEATSYLAVKTKDKNLTEQLTDYMRGIFGKIQKDLKLDGAMKTMNEETNEPHIDYLI